MAKANRNYTTSQPIPLSNLFADPVVRSAFERAERDGGATFAVPAVPPRVLDGGAVESTSELLEVAS
jgi:hypothetical protein